MYPFKTFWGRWAAIGAFLMALLFACTTNRTTKPGGNLPPETHLSLFFSDTLQLPGESTSMQVLHWYGDDPDGEVIGYEYRWSYEAESLWHFTIDVSDTFLVPIRVPHDTFSFAIRAMDNDSLRDPTPAHLSFPVMNSPPSVRFPVDFVSGYSDTIYNCFSYFSIGWSGSDPDGHATITGYDYYLADTSAMPIDTILHVAATPTSPPHDSIVWQDTFLVSDRWVHLDSLRNLKVFDDLQPGKHRFFLRCRDIANAYSKIIYYPDTTGVWNVMPIIGTALFVDDDLYASGIDSVIPNSLSAIYGASNFSTWVVYGRLSYYPRDIEHTLKLFPIIIWHGGSYPHFREASDAIVNYIGSGGRVLAFGADTVIWHAPASFLPVDTATTRYIGRSFKITAVDDAPSGYPDTLSSNVMGFPSYPLSKSIGFRPGLPRGLMSGSVRALYTQSADNNPSRIDTVAAKYTTLNGETKVVYFSMELYLCSARFGELMNYVIQEEFGDAGR
jgi:hypothetical protein